MSPRPDFIQMDPQKSKTNQGAFEDWWNDQENGCPPLVLNNDEQFARAVWDAAMSWRDLHADLIAPNTDVP